MKNQENSDYDLLQVGNVINKEAMTWNVTEVDLPEKKGNELLQFAASYGLTSTCESLLSRGYDVNGTDSLGWTPLMQAARAGHSDLVILFIKSGGTVDVLNSHGVDVFVLAAAKGSLEIMQILQKEKRNLEQSNYNLRAALEVCCLNGHLTCAKWLVNTTCVDFNGLSIQSGQTPLMLAVLGGHIEIVKFLLDNRCDLSIQNNFHQTAMDIAVFINDSSMVELLTVYATKPSTLQLPFTTVTPSLSSTYITGCTGLPVKENIDQCNGTHTRIFNNSQNSLNNSTVNKDKVYCKCKLSPKNGTDRFANVYFQFPSISCNESYSNLSVSSSASSASHVLLSSADSGQSLVSIISPRYFCVTRQKNPNSGKKLQFSAVTSCSTWFTKFVKRRTKSVNDSFYSSLNSPDLKLHKKKGIDFSNVFHGLGLQEYWPIFKEKELDLASFLTLTDDDLETMGIKYEADKCKILYAVERLKRSPL